jgi:hypothetical protein
MSKRISIDDNFIVTTKSNSDGTLVFCEGGYDERWYGVGDTVEMPWEELKDIRKYKRSFFENNWIILESNEEYTAAQMYETLGVSQYYPADESLKSVDDVLSMKPNEIAKFLKDKNEGYKETLYTYAKRLVEEGDKRLDSTAKRTAIEKAVGMSFDEV